MPKENIFSGKYEPDRDMWRRLSYFPRALKVRWIFAQRGPKWNGEWSTAEK